MTRLESIRNNTFLLGLDMNRATKEQKIQWLCQMIDNETDKPEDEMDLALIGECSAYLRELSDKAAEATKEQKQRILQQIKAHHNQTATTKSAKVLRSRWKTVRKVVAIAIAAVLLLVSTLTVIAKVKGYSNAWEYVKENIQRIVGLDAGDRMNEGEITLIKNDGVVTYKSVEELVQKEKMDIMYPSRLPDGIQITQISQHFMLENHIMYSIHFNTLGQSIAISSKRNFSQEYLEQHKKITFSFFTAYVVKEENEMYQVVVFDGKYEYLICCNNYEILMDILNSMKGSSQ